MLSVSGAVVRGKHETDVCGLVVDDRGSVCAFVVKVGAPVPGLGVAVAAAIGLAARAGVPIYELVSDVSRLAVSESGANVGMSLLRLSTRESRVEILNAGMPAVVRVLAGASPTLHPSRSGPIGNRFAEVHPYELTPLVWGSAWLLTSDGVTGGSLDPATLLRGIAASGLEQSAHELADGDVARVRAATIALSDHSGGAASVDRTLMVVSADPRRRFESGIENRG